MASEFELLLANTQPSGDGGCARGHAEGLTGSALLACTWIEAVMTAAGADIGSTLGAGTGLVLALPTGELGAPLTVPAGAALGAAGGAVVGNLAGQ